MAKMLANIILVADGGEQMIVCRWRDAKEGFPPSLYLSLTAGEKLNRKHHPLKQPKPERDVFDPKTKIDSIRDVVARYHPSRQGSYPHLRARID